MPQRMLGFRGADIWGQAISNMLEKLGQAGGQGLQQGMNQSEIGNLLNQMQQSQTTYAPQGGQTLDQFGQMNPLVPTTTQKPLMSQENLPQLTQLSQIPGGGQAIQLSEMIQKQNEPKYFTQNAGDVRYRQSPNGTITPVAAAPFKPTPSQNEVLLKTDVENGPGGHQTKVWYYGDPNTKAITKTERTSLGAPPSPSSGGMYGTPAERKEYAMAIADDIEAGRQFPNMQELRQYAGPVRAELAKRKYNLVTAEKDATAIKKHLSSLNGTQQVRLKQTIQFTYDSLDKIESMYKELESISPPSGYKLWNKGALAIARNLPGQTGVLAQGLLAQISDLTSELGTVYKGGNSSTDESLKLAAENLKTEWNPDQFHYNLGLVRNNLKIRKNSIDTALASGVSPNSPYQSQPTPGPTPAPTGAPKKSITLPDGTIVTEE